MKPQILLSFDIEEFDLPEEFGVPVPEEVKFALSGRGTENILKVIESAPQVRATFFVTGKFAEHHPDLIRRMVSGGHEIASHGLDHSVFEVSHLTESQAILEKISGQTVTGFRMARLAPVRKEEIKAAGYLYESSLNPVWLPGRYNHFCAPLRPFHEECGLIQVPVSAVPVIRFPLFWLSFKNLPYPVYRILARRTLKSNGFFNLYSHPWEYEKEAAEKKWHIPGYITRHAGDAMMARLAALIRDLTPYGEFNTFSNFCKTLSKSGE